MFIYNPSIEILEEIGIPQTTEQDYLSEITLQTGEDSKITRTLNDLHDYFELTQNEKERTRVETLLEKHGAFPIFNE